MSNPIDQISSLLPDGGKFCFCAQKFSRKSYFLVKEVGTAIKITREVSIFYIYSSQEFGNSVRQTERDNNKTRVAVLFQTELGARVNFCDNASYG